MGDHAMLFFVYSIISISWFTLASGTGPCLVIFGSLVMLTQAPSAAFFFIIMHLFKKKDYGIKNIIPEATFLHHAPYTIIFYGIQDC